MTQKARVETVDDKSRLLKNGYIFICLVLADRAFVQRKKIFAFFGLIYFVNTRNFHLLFLQTNGGNDYNIVSGVQGNFPHVFPAFSLLQVQRTREIPERTSSHGGDNLLP